jgi:hypothetical protein
MTNLLSVEVTPLRSFIDEFFGAWGGGMPDEVLSYFSEDAVIHLSNSAGTLAGKKMLAEKWVIPTVMKDRKFSRSGRPCRGGLALYRGPRLDG